MHKLTASLEAITGCCGMFSGSTSGITETHTTGRARFADGMRFRIVTVGEMRGGRYSMMATSESTTKEVNHD